MAKKDDLMRSNKLTYIGKLGKYKISENLVKENAMTNEEILKAAQSSKEDIGEYEKTVVRKSLAYGSAVGVGLCMLMVLLELLIFKKIWNVAVAVYPMIIKAIPSIQKLDLTSATSDVSKLSPCFPSITAFAITSAINFTALIASSFPGIG